MDELQVYDDLIQLDFTKYKERNDELERHINKLNADIQTLCTKLLDMKKLQESLVTNISALYTTAKNEIQRKDRMIAQLRKEKDDVLFRKGYNKRPYSRSRSKSRENKKSRYKDDNKQQLAESSKKNEVVTNRSSREKEQVKKIKDISINKRRENYYVDSSKSRQTKLSEYSDKRSNNKTDVSKNPNYREHRKNNEIGSLKPSSDKNNTHNLKQTVDLRAKLKPYEKSNPNPKKTSNTTPNTNPAPKLITLHDEMEDGEINDDFLVIDLSLDENGPQTKADLLEPVLATSKVDATDIQCDLNAGQFVISVADVFEGGIAETRVNEENIVELHIRGKAAMGGEEGEGVGEGAMVCGNDENVNTSNGVEGERSGGVSVMNSSRRRRRAVVFMS